MSIWNEIEKASKRNPKRHAIGESRGNGVVFRSYEKLRIDALGASVLLFEKGESRITSTELDAYHTAVLTLACSRAGAHLVFSESNDGGKGVLVGDEFISEDELDARLSGIISSPIPDIPSNSESAFFTLRDGSTYSESAAILSAKSFANGCPLVRTDSLAYLSHPDTAEGLFCGIIAPLIKGATSVRCTDARNMLKCMKMTSPTRLLCGETHAGALLLKLSRIKKLRLKEITRKRNDRSLKLLTDPAWVAIRRLIRPRLLYALGGKLKTVAVLGELSPRRTRAFFSCGIFTVSIRAEKGLCPSLFHYGGDGQGVWRLPEGSLADVCRTEKGGIGRIIISSPAIREGESLDSTYLPLEKRFDGEKVSLVSSLSGYILRDGSVFVVK